MVCGSLFQTVSPATSKALDPWQLTMMVHVQRICQTSFYQLRQLRSVRRLLSVNACATFVHVLVTSRLDYCNSLLAGIGDGLIDQLQTAMRVAARQVLRKRASSIQSRLTFVIVSIGFPSVQESTSSWGLLVLLHTSRRGLYWNQLFRPSSAFARRHEVHDLLVPRTKTKTIGPRSFATSGPDRWNKLPDDLRDLSVD